MLSRKTFATNSLKQNFLQDVWFGRDANYSNIKSTPNDSYSSIDAGKVRKLYFNKFSLSPLLPCNTLHKYLKISTPVGLTPKSDWDKKLQFRLLFT